MDILDFFWTFYLNHLSPLWGYFLKVRSWNDFEALKILLEGMQKSIEKFCEKHYTENDSDTN